MIQVELGVGAIEIKDCSWGAYEDTRLSAGVAHPSEESLESREWTGGGILSLGNWIPHISQPVSQTVIAFTGWLTSCSTFSPLKFFLSGIPTIVDRVFRSYHHLGTPFAVAICSSLSTSWTPGE